MKLGFTKCLFSSFLLGLFTTPLIVFGQGKPCRIADVTADGMGVNAGEAYQTCYDNLRRQCKPPNVLAPPKQIV